MGHIAVGVGCMDARLASGACGAQSQVMCALQQGWVLWARRGDAPQRQLEEVAAGRCITGQMSTLILKTLTPNWSRRASGKEAEGEEVVLASCLAGLSHGPADPEISDLTRQGKSSTQKHNWT